MFVRRRCKHEGGRAGCGIRDRFLPRRCGHTQHDPIAQPMREAVPISVSGTPSSPRLPILPPDPHGAEPLKRPPRADPPAPKDAERRHAALPLPRPRAAGVRLAQQEAAVARDGAGKVEGANAIGAGGGGNMVGLGVDGVGRGGDRGGVGAILRAEGVPRSGLVLRLGRGEAEADVGHRGFDAEGPVNGEVSQREVPVDGRQASVPDGGLKGKSMFVGIDWDLPANARVGVVAPPGAGREERWVGHGAYVSRVPDVPLAVRHR